MADQQEGDPQAIAENPFRLVVVAASAGGIAALTGGFPAAVAIVQHRTVIAQDQATSELFDMPRTAIGTGMVDLILPLTSIAPKLLSLVGK
jgi:chemotaxis response regulator CheB